MVRNGNETEYKLIQVVKDNNPIVWLFVSKWGRNPEMYPNSGGIVLNDWCDTQQNLRQKMEPLRPYKTRLTILPWKAMTCVTEINMLSFTSWSSGRKPILYDGLVGDFALTISLSNGKRQENGFDRWVSFCSYCSWLLTLYKQNKVLVIVCNDGNRIWWPKCKLRFWLVNGNWPSYWAFVVSQSELVVGCCLPLLYLMMPKE